MTNLEYLRKHSYAEIIEDTLDSVLDIFGNKEQDWEKISALKWVFSERKEKDDV